MRYKKAVLIVGGVTALTLLAGWLVFPCTPHGSLAYMQRISGVRLPPGIRDVSVYDNGETYVTAHVLLPAGAVNDFASQFAFQPVLHKEGAPVGIPGAPFGILGIEGLAPAFRTIPKDADLAEFHGRSTNNTWLFILDTRSGHLWFTVQYPDYGGDPP